MLPKIKSKHEDIAPKSEYLENETNSYAMSNNEALTIFPFLHLRFCFLQILVNLSALPFHHMFGVSIAFY